MEQFIIHWGYWAVALGCFFEGETVLVLAGMLAHKGYLRLDGVMLAAFLGSVSGDQLWFVLGRYAGNRWIGKLRRVQEMSERLTRWTTQHGNWFVFGFRFLYGIRSVAPAFLGISRFQVSRFVALNGAGAAVWSVIVGGLGWYVGLAVERVLGRAARIEEAVLGLLTIAVAIWAVVRARRARKLAIAQTRRDQ